MEVKAVTKNVRISAQKATDFARTIQGKTARDAVAMTELSPRKAARLFNKTLLSAIANAENNLDLKKSDLIVKTAVANPGPIMRRFRPKARGSAGRIRKRTSHFTVVLTDEKKG